MSNDTIYCMVHNPKGWNFAPACPVCAGNIPAPAAPQAEASAADLARAEEAATDVLLAFDGEQDFWSREEAVIGIIAGIIAAERMAERERMRQALEGLTGFLGVLANGQTVCGEKHAVAQRYLDAIDSVIRGGKP